MAIFAREMSSAEVRAMSRDAVAVRSRSRRSDEPRHRRNGHAAANGQHPRPHLVYRLHMPRYTQSEISCCVKYTVFGFNVVFWLVGMACFGIGCWAQIVKNPYSEIGPQLTKFYLDPTWLLLIVGFVVFIIGSSGCIGALRENTCLLSLYAILLGVLLLIQLAGSVLAFYVSKESLIKQLELELDSMIVSYRDDPDLQSVIDWIQKDWLHCCGIKKPDDWSMNIYFNESSEALGSPEAGGVPFSCCKIDDAAANALINFYCGHGVRKPDYRGTQQFYETGCLPKLVEWFNRHVLQVGIVLIVITVMEILGICFAQNLRSDIFAQRARWYQTH